MREETDFQRYDAVQAALDQRYVMKKWVNLVISMLIVVNSVPSTVSHRKMVRIDSRVSP